MQAAFTRKVGDTLKIRGHYRDAAGNLVDLSTAGIQIRSTIRSASDSRDFATQLADQVADRGGFVLVMDTSGLQPGSYDWDVRYHQAGNNQSTDTALIVLKPGVTA